jgi:hypothetical protein
MPVTQPVTRRALPIDMERSITVMHALEQLSPYRESLVVNVIGDTKWQEIMKRNETEFHDKFRKKLKISAIPWRLKTPPALSSLTKRS